MIQKRFKLTHERVRVFGRVICIIQQCFWAARRHRFGLLHTHILTRL